MDTATSTKRDRARYSDEQKDAVRLLYPRCKTTAEKQALADELGIESLQKLYNLASRLGATGQVGKDFADRTYDPRNDRARLFLREDPEVATPFTSEEDALLLESFPMSLSRFEKAIGYRREKWLSIEQLADKLGRSETAVAYRARHLTAKVMFSVKDISSVEERPLRRIPHFWDWSKVSSFLGIAPALTPVINPVRNPLNAVRAQYRLLAAEQQHAPSVAQLRHACMNEPAIVNADVDLIKLVIREERLTALWDLACKFEQKNKRRDLPAAYPDRDFSGFDVDAQSELRWALVDRAAESPKFQPDMIDEIKESLSILDALERRGLCLSSFATDGKTSVTLVSTTSLLRALELELPEAGPGEDRPMWQQLLEDRDADRYFLQELRESLELLWEDGRAVGDGCWERWRWLSHGGVSLCPYLPSSLGLVPDDKDFEITELRDIEPPLAA